jgi:hypothetical protein
MRTRTLVDQQHRDRHAAQFSCFIFQEQHLVVTMDSKNAISVTP